MPRARWSRKHARNTRGCRESPSGPTTFSNRAKRQRCVHVTIRGAANDFEGSGGAGRRGIALGSV